MADLMDEKQYRKQIFDRNLTNRYYHRNERIFDRNGNKYDRSREDKNYRKKESYRNENNNMERKFRKNSKRSRSSKKQ